MKKHFLIPAMFLFLGCSIIATPIENGDVIPSTWHGYYNSSATPNFDNISFSQFKIDENFINIKSGNYSSETGEPLQNTAGSYKITKTLKNTPEEYQVLIVDALADNPVERIFGLKKKSHTETYISEPVFWEDEEQDFTLDFQDYLYSDTYVDLSPVDPSTLDPSEVVLFDTFLEKMTGGKAEETWVLTPVAGSISMGFLKIIGIKNVLKILMVVQKSIKMDKEYGAMLMVKL